MSGGDWFAQLGRAMEIARRSPKPASSESLAFHARPASSISARVARNDREEARRDQPVSFELITEEQLAALVQMSPRWVREQRRAGRLPFRRLEPGPRGEIRFTREDVEAWLRSMHVPALPDQEPAK